jgi:voltage-gated potassium channel
LAGVVMIGGIACFALWAGILATGFAQEVRRQSFLETWGLVARVPLFRDAGASTIADVTRLLRRRDVQRGQEIIRKGDPGDCMYFVVGGEVEIRVEPGPVRLGAGGFFGEMALVTGEPRMATVAALSPSTLLVLDVADFLGMASSHPDLLRAIEDEAGRRGLGARRAKPAIPR